MYTLLNDTTRKPSRRITYDPIEDAFVASYLSASEVLPETIPAPPLYIYIYIYIHTYICIRVCVSLSLSLCLCTCVSRPLRANTCSMATAACFLRP